MLEETRRRIDRDPARLDRIGIDDAAPAAEVIGVAVGVEHRDDRAAAELRVGQRQPGRRRLDAGQRIDDDPAGRAAHQRHVRQVEAADLPDAVGDPEQPVPGKQRGVTPEAGVDGIGGKAGELRLVAQVADDAAIGGADHRIGERRDEAARREIEIRCVGEVEPRDARDVGDMGRGRRRLGGCRQ